ncbi:MAG: hypothetical protein K8R18_16510 [Parvibaculum sp.]|uniref:hypothetical protein n=1 Tax=Parvibaculum sp. TaxID=2024848 RepID=UPI0025ED6A5F|nr:hypothetical protein [Parvibaculum sp.]MCE9651223.1 hypothetical protein [Parvibaculum sp.]
MTATAGALAALIGFASLAVHADTLGTLPTGKVVTPGTITTTNPDGTVTTRPAPAGAPQSAPAQTQPAPSRAMTPVAEQGDPVAAPAASTSVSGPQATPDLKNPALSAGPQAIVPPGFGATSGSSGSGPAFPGGVDPSGEVKTFTAIPGRANSGIEMGELGGVDASAAGLIGAEDGGFGPDMWRGTMRADVDRNLASMPVATGSPVVNDLARRLLLTSATPPEGAGATSLLAARLDRLTAAGHADLAAELGRSAQADKSPPVAIARAQAALALGQDAEACGELADIPAGNDPAHDEAAAFSTKLSAFCQIQSGNKAAANLTLDLAREEGLDDPLFFSLAAQATDGLKLKSAEPKSIGILEARLYKLAKRDLPKTAGSIAVPAVVKTLAQDETLPPQTRIEAGERAAMLGLIKPEELAALYKLPAFKPDDLDNAKIGKFPAAPALRRAVLYQAIDAEVLPTDRIDLIKKMFASGAAGGVYLSTVQVLLPALTQLAPSPAVKDLAPTAVRAFLLAGDRDHAQQWYALVATQGEVAGPGAPMGREARELSALMRMSDPNGPGKLTDKIAAEIVADLKSGAADAQNFAATEAMLFDAFGQPLPQPVLEALGSAPRSVGAPEALLNQLHNAGLHGSVGEVVLLSLVAIGPGGPDSADRQAVAQSVSSLRAVHLDGEARRLATEALMGRSHAGRG